MSSILKPDGTKFNPDFIDRVSEMADTRIFQKWLGDTEEHDAMTRVNEIRESCGIESKSKIVRWGRYPKLEVEP